MNSSSGQQIKKAYELGKSPEFIAEDMGLQVEAVKAYLMQNSSEYRNDCKVEEPEKPVNNFTDEQHDVIKDVIYECATSAQLPDGSPDYRTKLKAAIYIRDDKMGRLNPVKAVQHGPQFNIMMLNESIQRARALSQTARASIAENSEVVEVQEVK